MRRMDNADSLRLQYAPFIKMWLDIESRRTLFDFDKEGFYNLLVKKADVCFEEVLNTIRNGFSNFVYVDGIYGNLQARGLLFTDTEKQLVTSEKCNFVGVIKNNAGTKENAIFTATQLNEFLGDNAKYIVCDIVFDELCKEDSFVKSAGSLISALKENNENV